MTQTISHSKEPIRLFHSDFLEFFTHIHPAVVAVVWGPVALIFLGLAVAGRPGDVSPLYIPAAFVIGALIWTLAEYTLHRFLFHFRPRNAWQERLSFLMHGVHHAQPMEKSRLVMPPPVSIPLAVVFYFIFRLLVGGLLGVQLWVAPLFSGFVAGYLAYDLIHYSLHHVRLPAGYPQFLRRHHMQHHSQLPMSRYGVSSPLWDYVFGTEPGMKPQTNTDQQR